MAGTWRCEPTTVPLRADVTCGRSLGLTDDGAAESRRLLRLTDDDQLLDEAEKRSGSSLRRRRFVAIAGTLVLLVGVATLWTSGPGSLVLLRSASPPPTSGATMMFASPLSSPLLVHARSHSVPPSPPPAPASSSTAPELRLTRPHSWLVLFVGHAGSSAFVQQLGWHPDVLVTGFEPVENLGAASQLAYTRAAFEAAERHNALANRSSHRTAGFKMRAAHVRTHLAEWSELLVRHGTRLLVMYDENSLASAVHRASNRAALCRLCSKLGIAVGAAGAAELHAPGSSASTPGSSASARAAVSAPAARNAVAPELAAGASSRSESPLLRLKCKQCSWDGNDSELQFLLAAGVLSVAEVRASYPVPISIKRTAREAAATAEITAELLRTVHALEEAMTAQKLKHADPDAYRPPTTATTDVLRVTTAMFNRDPVKTVRRALEHIGVEDATRITQNRNATATRVFMRAAPAATCERITNYAAVCDHFGGCRGLQWMLQELKGCSACSPKTKGCAEDAAFMQALTLPVSLGPGPEQDSPS